MVVRNQNSAVGVPVARLSPLLSTFAQIPPDCVEILTEDPDQLREIELTSNSNEEPRGNPLAAATTDVLDEMPPLAPAPRELLVALDRMLTTGTYYQPGHARYDAVAEQCAAAVAAALADQASLEIEITAEGIVIDGGFVAKDTHCARRVHELLEPLHQALLTVHAGVTTSELHEALTTLRSHHQKLSGSRDYREIEIEGMPEKVAVTGRNLYLRMRSGNGDEKTDSPVNEYFDPNTIPEAALVPTPEGQMMEREFLAVVQGLMLTTDAARLEALRNADDAQASELLGTWVPDHAVKTIKDILIALEETNSDPMMLQHLIGHAQTALQLTGDAALVEFVFEKLRKEEGARKKSQPLLENRPKPVRKPTRFTMSRAELRRAIAAVYADAGDNLTPEDLMLPTNPDCLGICLQILELSPNEELLAGVAATIRLILTGESVRDPDLAVVRGALLAAAAGGSEELLDRMVPMVCQPLRHARRDQLGPFLLELWHGLGNRSDQERVWPYVVNELLLGLQWKDPRPKLALYQALSGISVKGRADVLVKLEAMTALQQKILADDVFLAPAPLLYNVHDVLMKSSIADQHGPLLHQRLAHQKAHPLVPILMGGFAEYDNARRGVYEAVLAQGVGERVVPELQEIALRHLKGALTRLSAERRDEDWVPDAIRWLGRLGTVKVKPVIEGILNEKKFLVIPAWPAACRDAARDALAGSTQADGRPHHGDDVQ